MKNPYDRINVYNIFPGDFKHTFGEATVQGGQVALKSLLASTNALNSGGIEALVTAPINKNILSEKFNFVGHTEFLSNFFSSISHVYDRRNLKVGLLTDHLPIDKVSSSITKKL